MITTQSLTAPGATPAGAPLTGIGSAALSKDDFLKLLITQLRYQDPLEPLDQNQFLSQTAQFTQLENLQNIGKQLEDLKSISSASSLTQAAALLGKTVSVARREVSFDGASPVALAFTLSAPASSVDVDVLDAQGNRLRRLTSGALAAGQNAAAWDGTDDAGRPVVAGTYAYRASAMGTGAGASLAIVAQGVLTGLQTDGSRLVYRMGDTLVRTEDIVEVR